MLFNILPALILIALLNWLIPWFIARFDLWSFNKKLFSLSLITLIFFIIFLADYPVTIFRDYGFYKQWVGEEIYILNSAAFFFYLTLGISFFIAFLILFFAGKIKWFVALLGMVILAFSLNIMAVYTAIQFSLSNNTSTSHEISLSSYKKPNISLVFTAKYLALRLADKTDLLGVIALNEDDLAQWKRYHYLENFLYSSNDVLAEVSRALNKHSPDFINILKHERGYDSEIIKAFETYNKQDQ